MSPDFDPRDLKIGTDGVSRPVCKEKKVTVMKEKSRIRRRPDTGLEKNAERWVVIASVERKTGNKTGVCGPIMEIKTRSNKIRCGGKIIKSVHKMCLILRG